jgi:hypothetical protein
VTDPKDIRVTGLMVRKSKTEPKQAIKERFVHNEARMAEAPAPANGKWFWNSAPATGATLSSKGPWTAYTEEESERLERAYQFRQTMMYLGSVKTKVGTNHYYINFEVMEQLNCANGDLRRLIKRT